MGARFEWNEGDGAFTAAYEGIGNGSVAVSSDINEGIDRMQSMEISTTRGNNPKAVSVIVKQYGMREVFNVVEGEFILSEGGTFNVLKNELQQ